jgi:hypothetical protein
VTPRIRSRQPALFEAFEAAERARVRPSQASVENDARALERNADRLRDLGECWDGIADELDREAMELRKGVARCAGRSAGLRPEPPAASQPCGRLPTNARKDAA